MWDPRVHQGSRQLRSEKHREEKQKQSLKSDGQEVPKLKTQYQNLHTRSQSNLMGE